MKKVIKYIVSIVSILLVILSILIVVIGIYTMKNQKPLVVFGYYFSVVGSESMEGKKEDNPINKGDFIFVKEYDSYNIGDDIVFISTEENSKGLFIVHRIIEVRDDYYITHGINNPDNIVETPLKTNVIGKVINSFSFLGVGNLVLNQRGLIFFCFVILFLFYIVNQIVLIFKTYNSEKEKEKIEKWKEEIKNEILNEKQKDDN